MMVIIIIVIVIISCNILYIIMSGMLNSVDRSNWRVINRMPTKKLKIRFIFSQFVKLHHVRAVMHAGIANEQFPFIPGAGKTVPTFPVHALPAISRIW